MYEVSSHYKLFVTRLCDVKLWRCVTVTSLESHDA